MIFEVFGVRVPVIKADLSDENLAGKYDPKTKTIFVEARQNTESFVHSVLHELGHAMLHRTGMNQSLPGEIEELIVENFATLLIENYAWPDLEKFYRS